MFRNFSFDPASPPSYSAYEADRAAMNMSPTSTADQHQRFFARPPTPPCTIGDLASKLNQQSLRIDTKASPHGSAPLTPPADDGIIEPMPAAPQPTYSRVSASLLRMQRQSNSRMQCCSSHVRDISRLVQMIQEEEQCTINQIASRSSSTSSTSSSTSSSSSSSSSSACGDEGIDMDYDRPVQGIEALIGLPQRRASDRPDSCARVSRGVRMRRRSGNKVEKRRAC